MPDACQNACQIERNEKGAPLKTPYFMGGPTGTSPIAIGASPPLLSKSLNPKIKKPNQFTSIRFYGWALNDCLFRLLKIESLGITS